MLYLSEADVAALDPGVEPTIDIIAAALGALGRGDVEQAPKAGLHPRPGALFHALAARSAALGAVGVKWVSYDGANAARGVPGSSALLILNDIATGLPLCLMSALWLTRARTGACAAVAAAHLARPDASTVALVGCGPVARACVPYLAVRLPKLETVRLSARTPESAARGGDLLAAELDAVGSGGRLSLVPCPTAPSAVAGADVVVSAIGHPDTPPLGADDLAEGMLALPLEGEAAWSSEAFALADRVIADDAAHLVEGFARSRPGDPPPQIDGELGAVVAGALPGRSDPAQRIIGSNNGIGILDLALGRALFDAALAAGVGTELG